MRWIPVIATVVSTLTMHAGAGTVALVADRDGTLIEDSAGALANGSGPVFHAGRTAQRVGSIRRGVLHFDVGGALPKQAIIEAVRLTLRVSQANPGVARMRLHRLQEDWGEGASSTMGGSGAPAAAGDATWVHAFYPVSEWSRPGGFFVSRVSASTVVGGTGAYVWEGRRMENDVRLWLHAPHRNLGWVLIGDEAQSSSARRFDSREHPFAGQRPVLEIDFRMPADNKLP